MTDTPETDVKSFTIARYERSPLEFKGSVLLELEDLQPPQEGVSETHYRVKVYREFQRDYVLEIAVVADGKELFQTADFADSVQEIDDLLCLLHHDAMDGLWCVSKAEPADRKILSKRLEDQLDRISLQVLQRLSELVAG